MARAGLTPERLARAGAELADEEGFAHLTVAALARRFDVKTASLYSHVAGSDDLKTRIALLALDEMADRVAAALAGRSGRDALAAFADAYRDYARAHPGRWDAARHPLPADADPRAGVRHAEMTRALLRAYGLEEPDETHAVRAIGAAVQGFIALESAGAYARTPVAPEESWHWLIDALDTTLRRSR